jgi:glycosyltransferase involved in cell wall biosynthesis
MKKVLLRGPALTQSGYGVHCRQVASWLLSKKELDVKFQALSWGDTPWILDTNFGDGLIGKIMENTVDVSSGQRTGYDVTLQLQLPNEWDKNLGNFNVGLTAGVETDVCHPDWIHACNKMDMVIVPSNHTANCLRASGQLSKPLHVVPESFCGEILEVGQEDVSALPTLNTKFNFLVFGQFTGDNPFNDRKNLFFTLKWLFESFKDDPDVGIILKTNVGRNTMIDKRRTHDIVNAIKNECRKGSAFPKIHVLHGELNNKEVAALYRHPQVKALVTATRGEGYGLPILEAAASGLPIIATGWSGHTDFLNHGKYINLDYQLSNVHASRIDGSIFVPNSKWAEVKEEDFKKKVKKFRESPSTPLGWALELSKVLKEKYSPSAINAYYDATLSGIL